MQPTNCKHHSYVCTCFYSCDKVIPNYTSYFGVHNDLQQLLPASKYCLLIASASFSGTMDGSRSASCSIYGGPKIATQYLV